MGLYLYNLRYSTKQSGVVLHRSTRPILLGQTKDQRGLATGLGDTRESLADSTGGKVSHAFLTDPIAWKGDGSADQPISSRSDEPRFLEAVQSSAHRRACGWCVQTNGGHHSNRGNVDGRTHAS